MGDRLQTCLKAIGILSKPQLEDIVGIFLTLSILNRLVITTGRVMFV